MENSQTNLTLIKSEDRPKQSQTIGKIAASLAKAQGQMENADKDGKGTYGKYATLAATWDVIRKPLADNELAIYQRILTIGNKPTMCTMLIHSSGEFFDDCELELKFDSSGRMNAMQAMGSAVTYARRYSLQAITGVAPQDDDDGVASGPATPAPGKNHTPKPAPAQPKAKDPDDLDAALGAPAMSTLEKIYALIDERGWSPDVVKEKIKLCLGSVKTSKDFTPQEQENFYKYLTMTK